MGNNIKNSFFNNDKYNEKAKIPKEANLINDNSLKTDTIITISGNPGSGKSTIGEIIAKELNLEFYSSGDIMRKIASEKNMSINSFVKYLKRYKEIDKQIDEEISSLSKKRKNLLFVSRTGWYFVPESFKIYLYADEKICAKRIVLDSKRSSEKYNTYDAALMGIHNRSEDSRKRFLMYYGIDIADRDNYDLFLDTTEMSIDEVKNKILFEYNKFVCMKRGDCNNVKTIDNNRNQN